jgi:hypothetical protein
MNIYYYLFYKLSSALNKKGNNEWGPIGAITFLISLNIGLTYINIFPVTDENFADGHKTILIVVGIILFVSNTFLFLNKKRCREIMERYKKESLRSKRVGSFLVIFYVVITLMSIFFA